METSLREASADGVMLSSASGGLADQQVRFMAVAAVEGAVFLEIENRSSATIRVIWDGAAFVDRNGLSSRVVPGESRVVDMARSQPATPIPSQARARLWAIATQANDEPNRSFPTEEAARSYCEELLGSELRLVLPIEAESRTREYSLTFTVNAASLEIAGLPGRPVECSPGS